MKTFREIIVRTCGLPMKNEVSRTDPYWLAEGEWFVRRELFRDGDYDRRERTQAPTIAHRSASESFGIGGVHTFSEYALEIRLYPNDVRAIVVSTVGNTSSPSRIKYETDVSQVLGCHSVDEVCDSLAEMRHEIHGRPLLRTAGGDSAITLAGFRRWLESLGLPIESAEPASTN